MNITVTAKPGETTGTLSWRDMSFPCALGRTGIIPQANKQEGDGATPAGEWPLRHLLYRADRLDCPPTLLPTSPIDETDGWCDAQGDAAYNKPVTLPHGASAETLWRDDTLYDLIIVLGQNDSPVIPGKGSAIFFHLAVHKGSKLAPTEGCVALPLDALRQVLALCSTDTVMEIRCL
ncbi:MAG: hypothetical protein COA62_13185 [Rhodobiaceae bacterium]|nr:MAG: hypothetical protein COA62_13185 [Rhodobiaceae bacterium]